MECRIFIHVSFRYGPQWCNVRNWRMWDVRLHVSSLSAFVVVFRDAKTTPFLILWQSAFLKRISNVFWYKRPSALIWLPLVRVGGSFFFSGKIRCWMSWWPALSSFRKIFPSTGNCWIRNLRDTNYLWRKSKWRKSDSLPQVRRMSCDTSFAVLLIGLYPWIDCLIDWMIDRLVDWLLDWLIEVRCPSLFPSVLCVTPGVFELKLSDDQFSYQQIRAFSQINSLVQDPWNKNAVYWISSDLTIAGYVEEVFHTGSPHIRRHGDCDCTRSKEGIFHFDFAGAFSRRPRSSRADCPATRKWRHARQRLPRWAGFPGRWSRHHRGRNRKTASCSDSNAGHQPG